VGFSGFEGWQYGQVFGTIALLACLVLFVRIFRKPKGERLATGSTVLLVPLLFFTIVMAVVYVDGSQPWWEARATLNDSFDILDAVIDIEITDRDGYGPISVHDSQRPGRVPSLCSDRRLTGEGVITFAQPLRVEDLEQLALHLEDQEFTVVRSRETFEQITESVFGVTAVNNAVSYGYTFSELENDQQIRSSVNTRCIDQLTALTADCRSCVDSFVDPES